MVLPDIGEESVEKNIEVKKLTEIEELTGKLKISDEAKKLMRSVVENDKETIDEGKLIKEAYNQGMSSFTPSMMFENLVNNFSMAKKLYGETMIRLLTGYDPSYIEKNISVPEFKNLLKKAIEEKISRLKKDKILDKNDSITDAGAELAMVVMAAEELENIIPKGYLGEKIHKKANIYGEKEDYSVYKKGARYRDIAVKRSVKIAIRRGHEKIREKDLRSFERMQKGRVTIIYAVDCSGSMRGSKIDSAKRAGIALSYKAINEKDRVGLIIFGNDIKEAIMPTQDFSLLLRKLTKISASKETNIVLALNKAAEMFEDRDSTNHLIIITDVLPTAGEHPEKETLDKSAEIGSKGVTISIVGINLDKRGRELGRKIADIGHGRLYIAKNTEEIDKIVLEDYGEVV